MFERYTEWARRTIFHAKYEALSRGSAEIEPKDIVLGLTWDAHKSDCPFAMLHDNADELRKLIGSSQTVYGPPKNRDIPLSNDSKRVLAYAVREEELDRRYFIGGDHLLRGILRNGDQTAAKLVTGGYTLPTIRQASKQAHESSQTHLAGSLEMICMCSPAAIGDRRSRLYPERVPLHWKFSRHRRKLALATALLLFIIVILYLRSQN
jgi:ATP-dependent Clp protease ATP-binding subunit ClpC